MIAFPFFFSFVSNILDMRGSVLMKLMQSGFFFDTELGRVQIPFPDIGYACKVSVNKRF